eukprot:IDg23919t1
MSSEGKSFQHKSKASCDTTSVDRRSNSSECCLSCAFGLKFLNCMPPFLGRVCIGKSNRCRSAITESSQQTKLGGGATPEVALVYEIKVVQQHTFPHSGCKIDTKVHGLLVDYLVLVFIANPVLHFILGLSIGISIVNVRISALLQKRDWNRRLTQLLRSLSRYLCPCLRESIQRRAPSSSVWVPRPGPISPTENPPTTLCAAASKITSRNRHTVSAPDNLGLSSHNLSPAAHPSEGRLPHK